MKYIEKLAAIRAQMKADQLDAYIIASADPHMSEYLPDHYKCIEFMCGFTGSAGTLVITREFAGLWTDFRYFIQAEEQLKESGFSLVKLKVQHTPEYIGYLTEALTPQSTVGFNGELFSVELAIQLTAALARSGIAAQSADLLTRIWNNRPALPAAPAFLISEASAGRSVREKMTDVRLTLNRYGAGYHLISSLDDVAWLFNLRGRDVAYNPVVLSYAWLEPEKTFLCIAEGKLSIEEVKALNKEGVEVVPYDAVKDRLSNIPEGAAVFIDPRRSCFGLYTLVPETVRVVLDINPSTHLKSVKNKTEIVHFREALLKDGVAYTRFCKWLEENAGKIKITELSAAEKLEGLRAEQKGFAGPSFNTIGGYNAHAALPHYHATEESDADLLSEGLFLVDSGGQYHYGTTDITRMIPLGAATALQETDYTLVLKALIEGSKAVFPEGTTGYQIDAICRKPLWEAGINYGHGTGHGIGFYLNVHEGPQNIGPSAVAVPLKPGMVTSIEPGIYRPGKHGIRIENLILTIEKTSNGFGTFNAFETLTVAHVDTALIRKELLEADQVNWLNNYNQWVYEQLKPILAPNEAAWLAEKCRKI